MGYKELEGVRRGYKELLGVKGGYEGLQEFTNG